MTTIEQGCIDIWIDEIVPCLKDTVTGDIKETVVFKIESRTYLKKFQKANGWYIFIGIVLPLITTGMSLAVKNLLA